jgi:16S rRNA (guanine966-N2)-methyltransferase
MPKHRGNSSSRRNHSNASRISNNSCRAGKLRIIAGSHRGRTLLYQGNFSTRPMKDRTREALFSRLGGSFDGEIVFDIFAGTGILALEALSRGAGSAIVIDILPTATADIRSAAAEFGWQEKVQVLCGDAFTQSKTIFEKGNSNLTELHSPTPWLVFVCPPYVMWHERKDELRDLLNNVCLKAPTKSLLAIELEESTPLDILPGYLDWDVRLYRPAQVAIAEKY